MVTNHYWSDISAAFKVHIFFFAFSLAALKNCADKKTAQNWSKKTEVNSISVHTVLVRFHSRFKTCAHWRAKTCLDKVAPSKRKYS